MAYNKQNWENFPSTGTPISAERLSHMETQYDEAAAYTDSAVSDRAALDATGKVPVDLIPTSKSALPDTIPVRSAGGVIEGVGYPENPQDAANKEFVETFSASANDTTVSSLVSDVNSETRTSLNSVIQRSGRSSRANIRHKRTSLAVYDVIEVQGGRESIVKLAPKALRPDGSIPYNSQLTPSQMAWESGYMTLTNCDAASSGSNPRNNGLNIIEGVAYQDFGRGSGGLVGADLEALLLMKDGSIKAAYRSENKTAEQYVSEGAWSSFGYGPILIAAGEPQAWYDDPRFSGFVGSVSSRIIFGSTDLGSYKIILVEGKSNQYGIEGKQLNDLAVSEGLVWAVNLDGGGTTQAIYQGDPAHPSSDTSGERMCFSFIGVNADAQGRFDTGWVPLPPTPGTTTPGAGGNPLEVRQIGSEVHLRCFSFFDPPVANGTWKVVSDAVIPVRMRPKSSFDLRATLSAGSGRSTAVSVAGDWKVNARTVVGDSGTLAGMYGTLSALVASPSPNTIP